MIGFLARRLAWAAFVLWLVTSGVFLLISVIGDPARAVLGANAGPVQLADFRAKHGLDRPLDRRYLQYVSDLAELDLGTSFQDGRPVSELIAARLPRTLLLGGMTLAIEIGLALCLGVLAAVFKNSWLDRGILGLTFFGISLPTFVTGLFCLGYFALRLNWFPVGGYGADAWDHVWHAVLPALTLALMGGATYARVVRSELSEALQSDYVRTARAKGLTWSRVVLVHGLRNAVLPLVTLVGGSLRLLVSGAIVTEAIYGWPGMGRLAVEAISGLDLPVVMGIVFVVCCMVQLGNVLADVAVAILDPRVRSIG